MEKSDTLVDQEEQPLEDMFKADSGDKTDDKLASQTKDNEVLDKV